MNEREPNLNELLSKRFDADWGPTEERPTREQEYRLALDRISKIKGYPPEKIEEALLKKRYPEYCWARLKNELPDVPPAMRRV